MIALDSAHLQIVMTILHRLAPGRAAYVFGSRVNGKAKPTSDLDIALAGKRPLELTELGKLKEAFSESDLPFRVDVVDLQAVTDEFRQSISQEWEELELG